MFCISKFFHKIVNFDRMIICPSVRSYKVKSWKTLSQLYVLADTILAKYDKAEISSGRNQVIHKQKERVYKGSIDSLLFSVKNQIASLSQRVENKILKALIGTGSLILLMNKVTEIYHGMVWRERYWNKTAMR